MLAMINFKKRTILASKGTVVCAHFIQLKIKNQVNDTCFLLLSQ